MRRRIVGWLGLLDPDFEPEHPSDFAPFVSASVERNEESHDVDFLIDTGSDFTILMPTDAYHILGDAYFSLAFADPEEGRPIFGAGDESFAAVPIDVQIHCRDDADQLILVATRAWVPEPRPRVPAREGNWTMPSILGRDAIWPGDLEFKYTDSTVTLIRPDDE